MTKNEAIEEVRFNMSTIGLNDKAAKRVTEARNMAIQALEEVEALKEENETLKALYEDARKEGNNLLARARENAIDEFAKQMKKMCKGITIAEKAIDEIAEEIKGGV